MLNYISFLGGKLCEVFNFFIFKTWMKEKESKGHGKCLGIMYVI
jgi:hypothetical protein